MAEPLLWYVQPLKVILSQNHEVLLTSSKGNYVIEAIASGYWPPPEQPTNVKYYVTSGISGTFNTLEEAYKACQAHYDSLP
jgi:hypothetical protein